MTDAIDISIVVVTYNSRCVITSMLSSVQQAAEGLRAEVIMVDNQSVDGIEDVVARHFPFVRFVKADSNVGFGRANNIGLEICRGRVVVLLNPDTIVRPDFLKKILAHFDNDHTNCGAVGVHMINGEGHYLRESKRGYTRLRTSFFKLSGLWRLAKRSPKLNAYYMGHIDSHSTARVPILSGACMAFRREVLQREGSFDPEYFMYSEDIDLSWRYNTSTSGNVYRGDISILHFKGTSTPKSSRYIRYFYSAMLIFARKYEFPLHSVATNLFVTLGVYFGYVLAVIKSWAKRLKSRMLPDAKVEKILIVSTQTEVVKKALSGQISEELEQKISFANTLDNIQNHDTIIFDIDTTIDLALDFMEANPQRYVYGFCVPRCGNLYIYSKDEIRALNHPNI